MEGMGSDRTHGHIVMQLPVFLGIPSLHIRRMVKGKKKAGAKKQKARRLAHCGRRAFASSLGANYFFAFTNLYTAKVIGPISASSVFPSMATGVSSGTIRFGSSNVFSASGSPQWSVRHFPSVSS